MPKIIYMYIVLYTVFSSVLNLKESTMYVFNLLSFHNIYENQNFFFEAKNPS